MYVPRAVRAVGVVASYVRVPEGLIVELAERTGPAETILATLQG
jgi:hypothetical protein